IYVSLSLYLICGAMLFTVGFLDAYIGYRDGFLFCFIATFVMSICELYRKKGNAFQNLAFSYYGLFYISLPFTLLIYLPYVTNEVWHPIIVFFPFLLVWLNDSFAYLSGILLGKHKLFPRISPKKSWEGAIGGGIATLIAALAIAPYVEGLTIINNLIIACIVVVFGIFGDLIESMFKRSIEIKDSGDFMPGHGGILDRFDAVLFVIPALFVYLEFIY
ncbi:MAG: phosphatidate cytidylyltransferase, partial [Odoribacter sp.]|nr:phosphatidate cytidylyltransferase [Odoribacter sp.]